MAKLGKWLGATIITCLFLIGCGGGGSVTPPPPLPPPPPPPATDIWVDVKAAIDASSVADIRLMVGNGGGVVFSYEKGSFPVDQQYFLASSSKLLSGATIFRLVENGTLSLDSRPADIIPWWTSDSTDARSQVTLEQLLSFTSGFNDGPIAESCITDAATTMGACAREFYDAGIGTVPGDAYYYGPAHLQIAGHMAELATGMTYAQIFQAQIVDVLGLSNNTVFAFPSTANPRASGGGQSTAEDYAKVLRALLAGETVTDINAFTQDRTANVVFGFRPGATGVSGRDWHYGLGFWRQCDIPEWNNTCDDNIIISSGGAFGWRPWIDFNNNYFGQIAMEVTSGTHGAAALQRQIQPLIVTALAKL
ncbi:MAG: beta-lactamase family protein [Robiginitomaculum sp.]|nr:beta-lactamase family protein [Robiginitomaculum sp.]